MKSCKNLRALTYNYNCVESGACVTFSSRTETKKQKKNEDLSVIITLYVLALAELSFHGNSYIYTFYIIKKKKNLSTVLLYIFYAVCVQLL